MAIRVSVQYLPPIKAAAWRFIIGAVFLALLAAARKAKFPATSRQWRAVMVLSITMMALPYGLIFWADQFVNSSTTAVLYSASPLVVALLTPLVSHAHVPRSVLLSLLVGIGGIATIFNLQLTGSRETLVGGALILVSVLGSSFSTVFAKREMGKVDPMVSTALQLGIGSIPLFGVSVFFERGQVGDWNRIAIAALVFMGIFGSGIAFATYYWLLRHMPAYKASTINLVVPFVAIAEGALILHEHITAMMLLASVVVLGAVAFVLRAEREYSNSLRLASK
jgi:drug/metabolite transporter (DMT)-like permease